MSHRAKSLKAFRKLAWLNFFAVIVEKNVTRCFAAINPTKTAKKTTKHASSAPTKAQRSFEEIVALAVGRREYKYTATKLVACPSNKRRVQNKPPISFGSEKER